MSRTDTRPFIDRQVETAALDRLALFERHDQAPFVTVYQLQAYIKHQLCLIYTIDDIADVLRNNPCFRECSYNAFEMAL